MAICAALECQPGDLLEFVEIESGSSVVANPRAIAAAYRGDMQQFLARWRARCTAQGIAYVLARTDRRLDAVLREYLLGRGGAAEP